MQRFAVGYRLLPGAPEVFSEIVEDYREHIREVYFAWPGDPSGRAPVDPGARDQVIAELRRMRRLGLKLNLLFNASCYGSLALSPELAGHVAAVTRSLMDKVGLDAITTMSPFIAGRVKNDFPEIDIRASVNMRLGTVAGLAYVRGFFDSYTVQREYNRDPARLAELQEWAANNGKQLYVLANSGCLNFCSFQTFHDNVVAHEAAGRTAPGRTILATLCREYYSHREHWVNFLQGSWIRPEDIRRHRRYFQGGYKLATRMHDNPRLVIDAYARGKYYGNLLDLMEPGHGPLFHPWIVDNTRFPDDWFDRATRCDKRCGACDTCRDVLNKTLVRIPV